MEVTSKEQKRAEQLLQSQHIGLHQIKSFSFMKRYHQVPRKSNLAAKDKYGPGILTLHLKEGKEKAIYLLSHWGTPGKRQVGNSTHLPVNGECILGIRQMATGAHAQAEPDRTEEIRKLPQAEEL